MSMFCYQCEQTSKETACTSVGICGKDTDTAALQDLLIHACKGISWYAHRARQHGVTNHEADVFVMESLFTTVTNVNFDTADIERQVDEAYEVLKRIRSFYEKAVANAESAHDKPVGPALWEPEDGLYGKVKQGEAVTLAKRMELFGSDVTGLQELILYGVKGTAAYADHAKILGIESESVYAFFHEALSFLAENPTDIDTLVAMAMKVGEINLIVMEMLDRAHTETYGHPVPTKLRTTPVKGKAILISGHDMKDLEMLLKQTEGKGINIYTHGEMLPAHGYPELNKYPHLVGNYGGAWQDQRKEFDDFPGAILMTTNCIQNPRETYKARIFTTGLVKWPGVEHITDKDFTPVIEAALAAPGFKDDSVEAYTMTGFGHNAVTNVAGTVVDAVKAGKIRHFFLIGGCDGAKSGRNYYTDLATSTPDDTIILTLACGKFRFNKMDFGDIDGIPRMLDMGQCNDAYSAIVVAQALADAFEVGVNDLPLSLVLSWFEQKAVCILLTLLHLGIKNIRIGPSLPAFIVPNVLNVLVENFGLTPIDTPEGDLAKMLGQPI